MVDDKIIYEMVAKVDIMWAGMKVIYVLIAAQIGTTVFGIIRNGNERKKNGN